MSERTARLGDRLVAAKLLTREALDGALAVQKSQGGYLTDVLVDRGFLEEPALLGLLAEGSEVRTAAELSQVSPEEGLLQSLPVADAERLCVMPLSYDARTRTLTVAVPDGEPRFLEEVREATGAARLKPVLALHHAISACIQQCYYKDPYAFVWLQRRPATTRKIAQAAEVFMARLTPAPVNPRPKTLPPILLTQEAPPAPETPKAPTAPPDVLMKLYAELEDARRVIHILRVANDLSVHLVRERNVFELLQRVLAFAFDNLPADEGVLLLRDGASGALKPCAFRVRGSDSGREATVSQTLLDQLEKTGAPVLATDAAYDPVFWQSRTVETLKARSLMGVPFYVGDKLEGAITLMTYGTAGAFGPQELNVLTGIAAQTGVALENLTLNRRLSQEAQTRDRLSRFLSPALVEAATRGELALVESGQLVAATIVFVDIRGFTALAERMEPSQVVQLLNHHFELGMDVVFSRGGILDKFIGDGLMALWGVPLPQPDDGARALMAAVEIRARIHALRGVLGATAHYDIGIGVHTGPVVFGAIGAARRMELTAVGDAVNVAARLCGLAAPGEILCSMAAKDAAGGGFRFEAVPPVQLKGRTSPIEVFRVV